MTSPTPLEVLSSRATSSPDEIFAHFGEASSTVGSIWRGALRVAEALRRRGLGSRGRAVVAIANEPAFFGAFYGASLAGGIPVPLAPASGSRRLAAIAERCGAEHLVVARSDARAGLERDTGLRVLAVEEVEATEAPVSSRLPDREAEAFVQFTSGTTGEPKGVIVTHENLATNVAQMIDGFGLRRDDVFLSWLPAWHDMGLVLMTMAPLVLGAELHLRPASMASIRRWADDLARTGATVTAAPDFGYRLALRLARPADPTRLPRLRLALDAAEPVRLSTVEAFEARFGCPGAMVAGYGLAEATVGVTASPPGAGCRADDRGFVALGRGFPGVELAIDGAGEPASVGEVLVRSPARARGYWDDPDATAATFGADGFLRTGDLGYLERDGELVLVGRAKEMIVQGGWTIAPREVEELVDRVPGVRRSAAVGVDRGRLEGEQLYLFVEVERDEALPELHRTVLTTVHDYLGLRPGRVYLLPPATIPRTPNGKVQYRCLRTDYLAGDLPVLFPDY